jgi:thymidylate synthase (FAD)
MTARKKTSDNGSLVPRPRNDAESNTAQRVKRAAVSAVDVVLGDSIRVLDDGFIRLIDYMGDDSAVVQAARVSYGAGTTRTREDRGLIRYLMRHAHTTPFEMCEIKFHIRAPMDVWRQWIRHRTANVNEYSTRYSIAIDAAQKTPGDKWRLQSSENKQGSVGYLSKKDGDSFSAAEAEIHRASRALYEGRITAGIAREQARKDLPLSTYTEAYWKIDLHNLLHFLNLRMDDHAQQEIRSYATVIGEQIVAKWVPLVWEAFLDYRRHSLHLSRVEVEVLHALMENSTARALTVAQVHGLLSSAKSGQPVLTREGREFETKLAKLGLISPWK